MDFTKSKKNSEQEVTGNPGEHSGSESFIGKSISIKGNISSDGPVMFNGKINGNIKSKNAITIGQSGNTSGKLEADYIYLHGKANGTIITSKKLKIHSSAEFKGNITSSNVVIEEGGIFNGNMNMTDKNEK